jgi:outer membrane protein assembly factor BamB
VSGVRGGSDGSTAIDRTSGALGHGLQRHLPDVGRLAAIYDPPAIAGNVVAAVGEMHQLHAYDLSSGREVWSYDASRSDFDYASNGIAACDGAIIISDGNMGLVSLDAATGAER